jgi:hypothetical protein
MDLVLLIYISIDVHVLIEDVNSQFLIDAV